MVALPSPFGHSDRLSAVLIFMSPQLATNITVSAESRNRCRITASALGVAVASDPVRVRESLRLGEDLELDLRSYQLRRSGRVLKLERIPLEVLLLLVERRGQLVNREQIVERVWGKGVFLDTDNSINGAIRKIRQVLKDDPEQPRFVQTVTGRGYRFIAPVLEQMPSANHTRA